MQNRLLTITLITLTLMAAPCLTKALHAEQAQETSDAYSFRIEVERHLESKLNTVLREVTGIERLVAVVNAEVAYSGGSDDSADASSASSDKDSPKILFLPGVPARTGTTYFADNTGRPQLVVSHLSVKVMVNRDVSEELTALAHDVAISLVGFNPDRGDTLEMVQMDFMGSKDSDNSPYMLALSIAAILFFVAASVFFISPYRKLTETLKAAGIGTDRQATSPVENPPMTAGFIAPATLAYQQEGAQEAPKPVDIAASNRPFAFLEGIPVSDLLFAMRELEADHIATVLNYMPPALAADVLSRLQEAVRTEAVSKLINTRELNSHRTETLQETLKAKLKYTAGGAERLMKILENSDEHLRDTLMDSIEKTDHKTAERLSRGLSTFENVIRNSQAETIDALVRQFPPAQFARVLSSSSADVQGKVLESLGKGASELMREELKYSRPLSAGRLRDEKRRIVQRYKEMAKTGLIEDDTEREDS